MTSPRSSAPLSPLCQWLPSFALLAYTAIWTASIALTEGVSFDGAMNAHVSKNLADSGEYRTSYGDNRPFDHRIQTGVPYLAPLALVYRIAGVSLESTLTVNAVYLFLLIALSTCYTAVISKKPLLAPLPGCLMLLIPGLPEHAFGGYGEIPMFFFLLASAFSLSRLRETARLRWAVSFGTSLSLAYLTKTVALIALPAVLAIALADATIFKQFKRAQMIAACIAFAVPVALFEAFKLAQLGGSSYFHWWQVQSGFIFLQAGVASGLSDTAGLASKLHRHWSLLLGYFHLNTLPFFAAMLLIAALLSRSFLRAVRKLESPDYGVWLLAGIGGAYFAWWLGITPTEKAWARRILAAMMIIQFLGGLTIIRLALIAVRRRSGVARTIAAICALALGIALSYPGTGQWVRLAIRIHDSPMKTSIVEAVATLKKLSQDGGTFFAYGWWQNPLLSLLSNVEMQDLSRLSGTFSSTAEPRYFVADYYVNNLDRSEVTRVLDSLGHEQVYAGRYAHVYKLHDPPGIGAANEPAVVRKPLNILADDSDTFQGMHRFEASNRGRWLTRNCSFKLQLEADAKLNLELFVPDLSRYAGSRLEMEAFANNKQVLHYVFDYAGLHIITIPVAREAGGSRSEVRLHFSSQIADLTKDRRQLCALLKRADILEERKKAGAP